MTQNLFFSFVVLLVFCQMIRLFCCCSITTMALGHFCRDDGSSDGDGCECTEFAPCQERNINKLDPRGSAPIHGRHCGRGPQGAEPH